MLFGNKNKIKKRVLKSIDQRSIGLARRERKVGIARPIWRMIMIVFLVLIFVGSTAYLLFFSPFLAVTKINIHGAQDLSSGAIRDVAAATFDGKYFGAIAKNNLILISREELVRAVAEKFKRVEDVAVEKKFPDTLEISIKERKSMLVLCSNGSCFIVDNNGALYASADFSSNELQENNLLVINDDGNKAVQLGDRIFDQAYMQYLLAIKDSLKSDLNIDIDKNFHTPQLVSGDVRVTTTDGWLIYFDVNLPIRKEMEALKLVLNEKVGDSNRNNLEYVDLRTENKVYYKLKNAEPVQPPVEEVKKEEDNKKKK